MPPKADEHVKKAMPTKTCPDCQEENSVRKKMCNCGAVFRKKKQAPKKKSVATSPRELPKKYCPGCQAECAVAAASCKACSHEFRPLKVKVPKPPAAGGSKGRGRKKKIADPVAPAAAPAAPAAALESKPAAGKKGGRPAKKQKTSV
eukprot:gb/GEZN01026579.1/.p1 GENE.gb/GEZN01026579.1/~~gb/GEZN01026579.1/.p1  ORF type:complete len:170 (-),score=29.70 gb/GEZN01026579.1/:11-451(-)